MSETTTKDGANKCVPVTSSEPLKLPHEQENLFREVLSVLEKASVPYAVAGGFALQQHTGICRFTKDLDLMFTPEDASKAVKLLAAEGFHCEIPDPVWLAKAHRDGYFIDLITGMSNGAITVDKSWIERAHPGLIVGIQTKVLAPEELIASKLFVLRRERFDGSDIAHIIYARNRSIDWNRVLELAGDHWELVLWNLLLFRYAYPAQTNLLPPVLRDLIARLGDELQSPNPEAKFRGSLVDDKMFAIDVEEWGLENIEEECQRRRPKICP